MNTNTVQLVDEPSRSELRQSETLRRIYDATPSSMWLYYVTGYLVYGICYMDVLDTNTVQTFVELANIFRRGTAEDGRT